MNGLYVYLLPYNATLKVISLRPSAVYSKRTIFCYPNQKSGSYFAHNK